MAPEVGALALHNGIGGSISSDWVALSRRNIHSVFFFLYYAGFFFNFYYIAYLPYIREYLRIFSAIRYGEGAPLKLIP